MPRGGSALMSHIRRFVLFCAVVCCWGLAIVFTAFWLRMHIEHAEAVKTIRIPMMRTEKEGVSFFFALVDMDFCKWSYQSRDVRILFSAPNGTNLRKMLERYLISVRVNSEKHNLSAGNFHEPFAEMKRYAMNPGNCILAEPGLDFRKGENLISLELSPNPSDDAGLHAVLYFPDSEPGKTLSAVKGGGTLFFLLFAFVLSLFFFHCERKSPGWLHRVFKRAFLMIPVEFFLMLLSVTFWKAWFSGQVSRFPARLFADISPWDSPKALFRLFSGLNLCLFAVLLLVLLILISVRILKYLKSRF